MRRIVFLLAFQLSLLAFVASGAAKTSSRDGRVTGVIRLCGGPAPGRCFTQDGTVTATNSQGQLVATEQTKHAEFSFDLRPGTYTLEARTGGTRRKQTVLARKGKTTTANIVIPIP